MLVKLSRRFQPGDQAGSAIVVVLVIMLVLTIGGLAMAAIVTSTAGMLVHNRATAESRAAADAGLADAVATALRPGDFCSLNLDSVAPSFTVTSSCENNQVKFVSTGTGADGGTTTSEAVYEVNTTPADVAGGALFYKATTFDAGVKVLNTDPIAISVANGTFTCRTTIPGDIFASGDFKPNGGCTVKGSVYVNGVVTVSNDSTDSVEGNITAAGTGTSTVRGTVGSSTGGGDIAVGGKLTFSGSSKTTWGSVTASDNVTLGNSQQTIRGNLTLPADIPKPNGNPGPERLTGNGTVMGTILRPTTVAPPSKWVPPAWVDYKFETADWQPYNGVNFVDRSSSFTCSGFNSSTTTATWDALSAFDSPSIVNMTGCAVSSNHGLSPTVSLTTDLVFVANSFDLTTATFTSGDGAAHRLWIIVSDPTANKTPTCTNNGDIKINGTVAAASLVTMAYTPCVFRVNGMPPKDEFHGTIYANEFSYGGGIKLELVPMVLPGMSLEDLGGTSTEGAGSTTLGTLISQRDVP